MPVGARQTSRTRADEERGRAELRNEASRILTEAGLPPSERRVQVINFTDSELAPGSATWAKAFDGTLRQFLAAPKVQADLVLGSSTSEFVVALRAGLSDAEQLKLVRHAAGHIALGHIRLGDSYAHADSLQALSNGGPRRRWDREVEELLSNLGMRAEPQQFQVAGLAEAYARLVSGDVDPPELSAAALLGAFRSELVEVPGALTEHAELFPHQRRGVAELVARLRRFNVAILADSVGLGKTRTACALVRALKDNGDIVRAGVVVPRKLERNWRKEFAMVGLQEERDVALINKDQLKRWSAADAARTFKGCDVVIIDEAHQDMRNPNNRFYRNVRSGVGLAQGVLVTATPWNNRRGDIFAILSPFVRVAPGAARGAFDCFKRGFRTGRREFEESDDIFNTVYTSTVLQRTRRQLREHGDAQVYYAPRAPHLDTVPYTEPQRESFRRLLNVVEALTLPYFNPVRFLTSERDAEWRLSRTHRFMLLKRAESSMAAFELTLQGMRERCLILQSELRKIGDTDTDVARWLAQTYRIDEDALEDVLDTRNEAGLVEQRVTTPRHRRILRLIEDARARGNLGALRQHLLADAAADISLLESVERDFSHVFRADPKLALVRELVEARVQSGSGEKVLLISQFADTAYAVYRALLQQPNVAERGVGLIMSTSKGGEAPVQMNGRAATREGVLREFAPVAWEQSAIERSDGSTQNIIQAVSLAVLVGTDTISVGQNLQDCRTLFHLDLTWNPMLLEQRIGRLDRPRHQSDSAPIETRYFLNLDLIETELELKKRIDSRLEATYRDTAFDDEILPGYFELIERMRQLREERISSADLAREVDQLVQDLSTARPAGAPRDETDSRRVALERLAGLVRDSGAAAESIPPLVITSGLAIDAPECFAQVQLQPVDNNGRPIGPPDTRIVTLTRGGAAVDDLGRAVDVLCAPGSRRGEMSAGAPLLRDAEVEILGLADATKRQRNALREEQRRVRALTRPNWLPPLARGIRGMLERLLDRQYRTFLEQWSLTDAQLGAWLDRFAVGIDLDDSQLVEKVRKLETNVAQFLTDFGSIRDIVPEEDEGQTTPAQLQLDLKPVVHSVQARVTNLRLNVAASDGHG